MQTHDLIAARAALYANAVEKGHHDLADAHLVRLVALTSNLAQLTTRFHNHDRLGRAFKQASWDKNSTVNFDDKVISLGGHFIVANLRRTIIW